MLLHTEKDQFTDKEIVEAIKKHELETVPGQDELWQYYKAKNPKILNEPKPDPNNPDNRTPVPYGRKIVTTFVGYAYRPGYITYKSEEEDYLKQLRDTFKANNEHIKTSRAGRNTGIFGEAYEIVYIDGVLTDDPQITVKAEPRFFSVDPREVILYYDYSPEPKKKIGIRYYKPSKDLWKVEVYYADRVVKYDIDKSANQMSMSPSGVDWKIEETETAINFFRNIPIVPYYFGDDMLGIIRPVVPLINDYDVLVSDSINEFDRFAHAYLLLAKMSLTDPMLKKEPGAVSRALRFLKQRRVFEGLPDTNAVKFLTKDIPSAFMEYMSELIRNQVHIQSHVPDFTDARFAGPISGVAVQRLLFDFENVVSSAEADFDVGLYERIDLLNEFYASAGRLTGDAVVIDHKRNLPSDLREFADTAKVMSDTGFSRKIVAEVMPDEVIPDADEELARQDEDRDSEVSGMMRAEIERRGGEAE
jgi:SPP1 family phage portal protein